MEFEQAQTDLNFEICRNLRTKRYYFSDDPPATYLAQDNATTGYWCLCTMGVFGPDDRFVCANACTSHRSCYVSRISRSV